jgi:hypothetical protein
MARFRSLASRLTALFRRREWDNRVDEELDFHLRMETEENIRRGMDPSHARARPTARSATRPRCVRRFTA